MIKRREASKQHNWTYRLEECLFKLQNELYIRINYVMKWKWWHDSIVILQVLRFDSFDYCDFLFLLKENQKSNPANDSFGEPAGPGSSFQLPLAHLSGPDRFPPDNAVCAAMKNV